MLQLALSIVDGWFLPSCWIANHTRVDEEQLCATSIQLTTYQHIRYAELTLVLFQPVFQERDRREFTVARSSSQCGH